MGPVTLFDKSFLQSLSLDEAVWFDHFFAPVICPIFFVETLADLKKAQNEGSSRTPADEVRIIADKTPVYSGVPCAHHRNMCISNLLGDPSPNIGQVPMAGGRPVRTSDGKTGVVFESSPEAESFERWRRNEFHEIERDTASSWRHMLSNLNLASVAQKMRELGVTPQTCKTISDAYGRAARLVHTKVCPKEQLALISTFVDIPISVNAQILAGWESAGFPPLAKYAPYAAHLLTVEIFFQLALGANLISSDRASNRADIAYLFYLPFTQIFVSSDKLHRRCAPEFLEKSQEFVWGPDLKAALAKINQTFSTASDLERQHGLTKLAPTPPGDATDLVFALWAKHLNGHPSSLIDLPLSSVSEKLLLEHFKKFSEAPIAPFVSTIQSNDLDGLTFKTRVQSKRGSWWIVPKTAAEKSRR
jgi:hypothetical protein